MSSDDGETKPVVIGVDATTVGIAQQQTGDSIGTRTTPPGRAPTPPTTIVASDPFDDPPPRPRMTITNNAGQPMSEMRNSASQSK